MTLFQSRKASLLSALFLCALLVACEKFPDETIGQEIQPAEDQIGLGVIDTFAIQTQTRKADSLPTDEVNNNLIGALVDPIFGRLTCASYLQVRLATENNSFNVADIAVDSVVFSLALDGKFYGDTTSTMALTVREINQVFSADSTYFSNAGLSTSAEVLNENPNEQLAFRPKSPIVVGTDTLTPGVRIRLKKEFGQKIISAPSATLANNTAFTQFLPGLKVSVENNAVSGSGAVAHINPVSLQSRLFIYYRTSQDTLVFSMPLNNSSARYTQFETQYAGTPVQTQLDNPGQVFDEVYVQSGGGVRSQLTIAGLDALRDSAQIVINKAELILPITDATLVPFGPHERLFLAATDENGKREILPDQLEGDTHFGGFYNTADRSYHFVITRYVQSLISGGKVNRGLQVIAGNSAVSANRTILVGGNNPVKKPKLIISFSRP